MKKIYKIPIGIFLLISNCALAQPTVPANPAAGNSSSCTTNSSITTCPANSSGVQTNFTNGVYNRNAINASITDRLVAGAVWRFTNIANVTGTQVNAEVKVDAISNATLVNSGTGSNTSSTARIEDDNAKDQNGNSIASFFAPQISSISSTSSTRGYVQFTMTFFGNTNGGFTDSINLQNLNFVHLDIDGNNDNSGWFRETGNALSYGTNNPVVIANGTASGGTELVAYSYTDNTTTPGGSWTGYAGSVFERSGVSLCAEVAAAYRYNGNRKFITFRMGYDFKKGTANLSATSRQYGATFGCFNFQSEITLPVKLLSFTGSYHNQASLLNWEVTDELNFDHYDIERSSNGYDFTKVGSQQALGTQSGKRQYQFSDDLSAASGNVFYYRLKMVDIDAKAKYSNVIMIRKDQKSINGISIVPNPIANDMATVRLSSSATGAVELRVIDLAGKIVLHQQNQVFEGNNSISINNLDRLQSGIYTLQIVNGETIMSSKFSLIK